MLKSMTLTIRKKLILAVVFFIALLSCSGLTVLTVQSRLNHQLKTVSIQGEKLALISDLQLAVEEAIMPGNDYIITGKASYRNDFAAQDKIVQQLYQSISEFGHFTGTEADQIRNTQNQYQNLKKLSDRIFAKSHRDPEQTVLMEDMDYNYAAPLLLELGTVREQIRRSFDSAQNEAEQLVIFSRNVLIGVFLSGVLLMALAGRYVGSSITAPLCQVNTSLAEIADGRGNLTTRLPVRTNDEIGTLSTRFNQFSDHLQEMVGDVSKVEQELSNKAHAIHQSSGLILRVARGQLESLESAYSTTEELNAAIRVIAQDTDKLNKSAASVSSSSLELSSSLDEVAEKTERLESSSDQTLSAVNEIVMTFKQIADNVTLLSTKAGEVASSAEQINSVAQEISSHSKEQAAVAKEVKQDAQNFGLTAISKTKQKMAMIRNEVSTTSNVMNQLGIATGEIGRIVSLITEITDKTDLLALNASILAAQSGVHGKGFTVVAEEVKDLALQAAASTKEIDTVVSQIRQWTAHAITAATNSVKEVDEGVSLSHEAETALLTIVSKTDLSLEHAVQIANAAEEQTKSIGLVSSAMQDISYMVQLIDRATTQQQISSEHILQATEEVRNIIHATKLSAVSQSSETQRITAMIVEMSDMIQMIAKATAEQQKASQEIVKTFQAIHGSAVNTTDLVNQLTSSARTLQTQADKLHEHINEFII